MKKRLAVAAITNTLAGGNPLEVVSALRDHDNIGLHEFITRSPGDAETIAHELTGGGDIDVVVAIGGDGTAGEVARGMYSAVGRPIGYRPKLLIAPGGTGNSNYRCLWEDKPWLEVIEAVFTSGDAVCKPIDLAWIAKLDKPALLGISAGLLPEALTISHSLQSDGREKLAEAALMALQSYQGYAGRVTVDGELLVETEILAVLIGGSRYRGGFLNLLPRSILDDGLLDVCVVNARMDREEFAMACVNGTLGAVPGSHYRSGKSVRIERLDGQSLKIDHDGELGTVESPAFDIDVLPSAIDVLASPTTQIWSD
ncbi:diacylglycerol kinase family protein [Nocardia ninae]|uniref:DAGKc domain-containing protein n=1 Tax=Nocardia ninae NBRC 108245 TaxID=1210091 RepID=A0A511MHU3_9NOCA|nr:diacylglycerol kinase family protein [Nocardia ninae]GEM40149.1 hypothetical protein NN4_46680 [Nocardia ninae NBRC 108245]